METTTGILNNFKEEMTEYQCDKSEIKYLSLVDYPEMYPQTGGGFGGGSDGIDYVRLDDETIAYRINTEETTGDWELQSGLNDEKNFDEFICNLAKSFNQKFE
jgi:hypothetical protein